jgi:ABC-2 type transport system permease protein
MGEATESIFLQPDMGPAEIRQEVEAALKRSAEGFLKTIGVWTPPAPPSMGLHNGQPPEYRLFPQLLRDEYNVEPVDLNSGHVSGEVDVLLLVAPQQMTELEKFAVDQYLMRSGSVVALAGNYTLDINPAAQSLNLKEIEGGINDLLSHYGVTVEPSLVLDQQNEPFPVPVARDLGGIVVQEIQHLDYPFFVDIREDGMDRDHPALASLPAVTMNWVSPLTIDPGKTAGLSASTLLQSSPASWIQTDTVIQPDFDRFPDYGFQVGEDQGPRILAVTLNGSFASYFHGKPDPRTGPPGAASGDPGDPAETDLDGSEEARPDESPAVLSPVIAESPDSSRLAVVGSSEFISDAVISISQSMGKERILNNLDFLQNLIDWAIEEEGLLAIRSRGSHARLLYPLSSRQQSLWEFGNYLFALLALVLVSWHGSRRRHRERPMDLEPK